MYSKHIEPYKEACWMAVVEDKWELYGKLCPDTVEAAKAALDGMPTDTWQGRKARRVKFGPAIVAEIKRLEMPLKQL